MTSSGKMSKSIAMAAITIAFIAAASLLVLYVVHFGRSDFSSDDSVLSLQAESMWEQGTLLPDGWVGNNGDLMLPSGVLLLAPLLNWFSNSYELHAVAGVFSIVLMLGTFCTFLLRGKVPLPIVLLAATVLASGLSRMSAIMLFLQTTYVWWPSAFFLGATVIWRERQLLSSGNAFSAFGIALLGLVVFLTTFANPGRALLMVVFPLYVFDRYLAIVKPSRHSAPGTQWLSNLGIRDSLTVFGIGLGFALAALAYYGLFRAGLVQTIHNSSALRWEGLAGVGVHWEIFRSGWLNYLGGMREMNAPTGALEDVLRTLRMGFAIWLTWVGFAEIWRMFRSPEPLRGALAAAFLAAFVPIFVLYVSFAPLAISNSTTRYFTVPVIMLLAMAAFRVSGASKRLRWLGLPLSIVFGGFMVLVCAVRFVPATSKSDMDFLDLRDSFAFRIVALLERENLSWGYATWWNAGVMTILSSERVRVNPVDFSGSNIIPFPNMTQQRHFLPQAHVGESFLLLRPGEASTERLSAMGAILGKPSRIVESKDAIVYVYPKNISSSFCAAGPRMDDALNPVSVQSRVIQVTRNARSEDHGFDTVSVTASNEGSEVLGGTGRYPISIGIQLLDDEGTMLAPDWVHFALPCALRPGDQRVFVVDLPALPPRARVGKVGFVQEGVAWFEQWGVEPVLLPLDGSDNERISIKNFDQH